MRWVDRWVGVGLCLALTVVRRLLGRRAVDSEAPPRSILFVKLAEQGSTVLAVPALRRAIELAGPGRVYFLVFEENRFVLDALGLIPRENIISVRADSLASALRTSLGAVRRLRALRLEAAIDLEFYARSSAIFTWLSGAKRRVGLHSYAGEGPYRGDLMTHRLIYNPYLHIGDFFYAMVEALLHPASAFPAFDLRPPVLDAPPTLCPAAAADLDTVRRTLAAELGRTDIPPLVLLNANCSDLLPIRKWPDDRYIELAKRLIAQNPEVVVAFTGAPNEAPGAGRLAAAVGSPRCISLAGKTTLKGLLALYELAEVLVTNDSGPAHFATLTPIDIVVLFGPETPRLFGARTPRNHVLWSGLACSPCVNAFNNRLSRCRRNLCMEGITVDQVFEAVREIHERRSLS